MRHDRPERRRVGGARPIGAARRRRAARTALSLLIGALAVALPVAARAPPPNPISTIPDRPHADFGTEDASRDAREIGDWIVASRDNHALPFLIVDKVAAKVFVFDTRGRIRGAAPALLGLSQGDDSAPGIGQRRLATIRPAERTTPAGRFEAALGRDLEQDILWIDYDAALSLHRVIVGNSRDRRSARLASPTPLDNRISYGCINVPAAFYDAVVASAFAGTVGIVYILPETRSLGAVFALKSAAGTDLTASH